MAEINGVSVKGLKEFRGHDGPGYLQGNVYIDGKKVGFWSQDSWGGPDDFDFDTKELEKRAKEYYTKYPDVDTIKLYKMSSDIKSIDFKNLPRCKAEDMHEIESSFINDIVKLVQIEKWYKKMSKQGYNTVGVLNFYSGQWPIPYVNDMMASTDENAIKKAFKEYTDKYPYAYIDFYKSLNDFVIAA